MAVKLSEPNWRPQSLAEGIQCRDGLLLLMDLQCLLRVRPYSCLLIADVLDRTEVTVAGMSNLESSLAMTNMTGEPTLFQVTKNTHKLLLNFIQ